MKIQLENIPNNWSLPSLQDIAEINPKIEKSNYDDDLTISFVPMPSVGAANGYIDVSNTRKFGDVKKGFTPFQEGDVLFAKITPCMENGKMAVVPQLENKLGFGSTEFHVLRPKAKIDKTLIYFYISSQQFRYEAEHNMTGAVGQRRVPTSYLSNQKFPLPPFNEQKRIVAKIEELFSELDNGIESLKKAQKQLKVYRQAVLKHAFEGKLTKKWREENKDKLESADQLLARIQKERNIWLNSQIKLNNNEAKRIKNKIQKHEFKAPEEKIPKNWSWTSLTESCQLVVDCHNKTAPYESKGIYLIRTSNIRNGKFNLDSNMKYVSEKTYQFWSRRCPPESGDILFTREAPMGEAAQIPNNKKFCMGQRIMLLRVYPKFIYEKYLLYNIMSPKFQSRVTKNAIGTGVKHLRVGDVEQLTYPLCSFEEQIQIVKQLDFQLSITDGLQEKINDNLKQLESLRQSILKKAFSGELVPQDPKDEPASVLLERIQAEKAKQESSAKKTKPKTKSKRKSAA
jgi:type I restriction enzyme S subunit